MKVRPELLIPFFLVSCIYDPPLKGKTVFIHNQTGQQLFVAESLTGNYFNLYFNATVSSRRYISRQPDFMTEYGLLEQFYSTSEMDSLQQNRKNKLTLYFVDQAHLQETPNMVLAKHLYRSFDINIDTLKKYELNHLFVTQNAILFEHNYDYTNRRQ
jgi:hypothetical protein